MYTNKIIRLTLLFSLLIAVAGTLYSCKGMARAAHKSSVADDKIQQLKSRTVVFVLPQNEYAYLEDYKELIPKAWTLTPIEVIKYSDRSKYFSQASKYAFFTLGGIQKTSTSGNNTMTHTYYYLTLALPTGVTKKGKVKSDELCRIEIYPDFKTASKSFTKNTEGELYTDGELRNFSLPYMMAYLRFVEKNLKNGKNPWVYENYSDAVLKQKLGRDTLYVPETYIHDRRAFTGKESEKPESFFQAYGGKYKIVSKAELISLIKDRKTSKPLFLFEYILSSTDKYVGILEVNSGTIVYRKYTPISYNLKTKDIKDIL